MYPLGCIKLPTPQEEGEKTKTVGNDMLFGNDPSDRVMTVCSGHVD